MSLDLDDTIAAIASAPGGAIRGIVRVSGRQSIDCIRSLIVSEESMRLGDLHRPTCLSVAISLPRGMPPCPALLYLWPTSRSYTHQPSAELHLPGSMPILEAALEAVCQAGARLAGPGEFTLRAFLAGRLDLTQAEAVLGVIDAHSQSELSTALGQLAGGVARPLSALRSRLLDLLADLEAGLDFAEEDIEFIDRTDLEQQLTTAADDVGELVARMSTRHQAGRLPRVVLVGPPNAGKSSLLNALAGNAAAIVAPVAGTTRDHVHSRVAVGGMELELIDTPGEEVAAEGSLSGQAQRLRREQLAQADLLVHCCDASQAQPADFTLSPSEGTAAAICVWTKCDLAATSPMPPAIPTSSRTGAGLEVLKKRIADCLQSKPADAAVVAGTADRCRDSLRLAFAALTRARDLARANGKEELIAAEARLALDELGHVIGAVYTDDVLDRIFSRFCIGK